MGRRGDAWDDTLGTPGLLPDVWPRWARLVFLFTLPISLPLYVLLVITPWTLVSASLHLADWVETMWKR